MNKNVLTIQEILVWIMENSDNTELMDKVNKATFPFSSFYRNRGNR